MPRRSTRSCASTPARTSIRSTRRKARIDQLRWFDYWLKGIDTGIMDEPPVKLEIRTGGSKKPYPFRFENEWPLARTQWTKLYLRIDREQGHDEMAAEGELVRDAARDRGQAELSGERRDHGGRGLGLIAVDHARRRRPAGRLVRDARRCPADTEITGPLVMNLWVSSTTEDMDIFVTLRNIGPDGKDVCEVGQHGQPVPRHQGLAARLAPQARSRRSRCRTGRITRTTSGCG